MWRRNLQRAIEVLRTEGVWSLWFKVLGETVYRRVVLMERLLDEPVAEVTPRLPMVVGLLRDTEVDDYITLRPETDPAEVRRRLQAGQTCFVARYEGRIVHACWVATGRVWIDYLAREIALAPDEVYSYESFTAPDARGQNVAAARLAVMQQTLRQAGCHRIVAVMVPENKVAFRPVEKVGYRRVGVLRTVRVGPWRRDFGQVAPGKPSNTDSLAYWDGVARQSSSCLHYLDPFLGEMKRQALLDLVERWGRMRF